VEAEASFAQFAHTPLRQVEAVIDEMVGHALLELTEASFVGRESGEVRDRLLEPKLSTVRAYLEQDVGILLAPLEMVPRDVIGPGAAHRPDHGQVPVDFRQLAIGQMIA